MRAGWSSQKKDCFPYSCRADEMPRLQQRLAAMLCENKKDHNEETGRGKKTRKLYKEIDAILGHRPASAPTVLVDTGTSSKSSDNTVYDSQESAEGE